MWAYFIMPAYNSTTGDPMGMFQNSTKETKEYEVINIKNTIKWRKKSQNNRIISLNIISWL
tara:strand:+ start:401 stop:583 length:183 start_codon:yes stop_codon:yes gene_type:complete